MTNIVIIRRAFPSQVLASPLQSEELPAQPQAVLQLVLRVSAACRHGAVESGLLIGRLSVLAVELALPVDVDVAPGLGVPVRLNGSGLTFPVELRGIFQPPWLSPIGCTAVHAST